MEKYSVTTPDELRNLCIRKNWFTCGSNSQYNKLFYTNRTGYSIDEIATIIWLCSDEEQCCRLDILEELKAVHEEYLESIAEWERMVLKKLKGRKKNGAM